ncbi:hypothetical protein PR048_011733 [Dryococelus australis]|uniref:Uncharacterized protein n=1 Tax=Dryococelus australis TaxID=614101 RepID=A0ABQ9HMX6_9NEOP|nr:hypothetical protein PR048_011733 [Dryococelus australis]
MRGHLWSMRGDFQSTSGNLRSMRSQLWCTREHLHSMRSHMRKMRGHLCSRTHLRNMRDELQNEQSSALNTDDAHATPTNKIKLNIEDETGYKDNHEESIDDNDYDDSVDEVSDEYDYSPDVPTHLYNEFPWRSGMKKAKGIKNAPGLSHASEGVTSSFPSFLCEVYCDWLLVEAAKPSQGTYGSTDFDSSALYQPKGVEGEGGNSLVGYQRIWGSAGALRRLSGGMPLDELPTGWELWRPMPRTISLPPNGRKFPFLLGMRTAEGLAIRHGERHTSGQANGSAKSERDKGRESSSTSCRQDCVPSNPQDYFTGSGRHLPQRWAHDRAIACSPPTKANRAQYPAGSPDFRKWESCRTLPLVGGFSRVSPISPSPSFRRRSIFSSITLIGSQDFAVKIRPNLLIYISCNESLTAGIHSCSPEKLSDCGDGERGTGRVSFLVALTRSSVLTIHSSSVELENSVFLVTVAERGYGIEYHPRHRSRELSFCQQFIQWHPAEQPSLEHRCSPKFSGGGRVNFSPFSSLNLDGKTPDLVSRSLAAEETTSILPNVPCARFAASANSQSQHASRWKEGKEGVTHKQRWVPLSPNSQSQHTSHEKGSGRGKGRMHLAKHNTYDELMGLVYFLPGAAVAERLACTPPTKSNRVKFPAGQLPDIRMLKSVDFLGDIQISPPFLSSPTSPPCSRVLLAPSRTVAFTRGVSRPLVRPHHADSRRHSSSSPMSLAALSKLHLPTESLPFDRCNICSVVGHRQDISLNAALCRVSYFPEYSCASSKLSSRARGCDASQVAAVNHSPGCPRGGEVKVGEASGSASGEGRIEVRQPLQSRTAHVALATSGTIPTCENLGVTRPGIESGLPWCEAIGDEDSKRPSRMQQQSLNSELILSKEQLYDMFQQILGVKKFEHQLLFNALQLDSADEQAAAIRRELDGRMQKVAEMEKVRNISLRNCVHCTLHLVTKMDRVVVFVGDRNRLFPVPQMFSGDRNKSRAGWTMFCLGVTCTVKYCLSKQQKKTEILWYGSSVSDPVLKQEVVYRICVIAP